MAKYTRFEDFSNEIFFEIFDYFHALDIFIGFTSLNQRFTSILQIIPLRVVIAFYHSRRQLNFLSTYLTFHAHQLISLKISDTIFDELSTISLLFHRHKFINLQFCSFISINPSSTLNNVIEQMQSLNKLISFAIYQRHNAILNDNVTHDLIQSMLMHKSSYLHSLVLRLPYNYQNISKYPSISSSLRSLDLNISGSQSISSILRCCHSLQHLSLTLMPANSFETNIGDFTIEAQPRQDNHHPILSQMISFNFKILAQCDHRFISYILQCMPNLKRFYFYMSERTPSWSFPGELLDGHLWKEMLEHLPYLSKFEFYMLVVKPFPKLNLYTIVNSFLKFVKKYPDWHMVVDRWRMNSRYLIEVIILRTLNYHKLKAEICSDSPSISNQSYETLSTTIINDHHEFYQDIRKLQIYITKKKPTIIGPSPLYQHVNYVIIEVPSRASVWNSFLNLVNLNGTSDKDAQNNITCLSQFLHLSNITEIVFGPTFDVSRWKDMQLILQSCPNVTILTMNARLLIYPKFIDNPFLIPIFKQIKIIESLPETVYIPRNFAFKLVERFPSLAQMGFKVYSFDNCVSIIDTFLIHLKKFHHVIIFYSKDTLLDDPFSRDYIIKKRREMFPDQNFNEQMVDVRNNGEDVEIYLL